MPMMRTSVDYLEMAWLEFNAEEVSGKLAKSLDARLGGALFQMPWRLVLKSYGHHRPAVQSVAQVANGMLQAGASR